ncbi:MAG: hypothetical protein WKF77_26980 [Planctomycetaceae bacterium]
MTIQRPFVLLVLLAGLLRANLAFAAGASQETDVTALGAEVTALSSQALDEDAIRRLIIIDQALAKDQEVRVAVDQQRVLMALAKSQDTVAMDHVRSVFENAPERRGSAAQALAAATTLRPTDLQDWRYMVRSLPVVQGEEAVDVLNALQRFRTRANKGQWVRQVILIGLTLPVDQQSAATGLLHHWTGVPLRKSEVGEWTLEKYQQWFAKEYADQPAAVLPVDAAARKRTMATLEPVLRTFKTSEALRQQGERVYQSAGCQKCHRRGKAGENLGPDLTTLGWRRQRREILHATLYPSHELNEEYPTVTIVLKSGKALTGMLSASSADALAIVSSTGMRAEFPRTEVETIVNHKTSNMPDGLLEPLSEDEIMSLIAFLSSVDGIPRPHTDEGP